MKIVAKSTRQEYHVDFSKYNGIESTQCPACSSNRKKQKDKCFNWNHNDKVGKCHNCGEAFYEFKDFQPKEKKYERPVWSNNTNLSDKVVKYFEGRGISQFILRRMKITSGMNWMQKFEKEVETINFNYFRGEELINIKYRGPEKSFGLFKGAELILYNLNGIENNDFAVIVEGEIDCLSFIEVGIKNCVSVPNGAKNFDFIDACYNDIERIEKWYIAVDSDEAGIQLRNELIRRIGAEKCLLIDFKDCKDANEYLIKYGKDELKNILETAKEIPLDGVFTVSMEWEKMLNEFRNGKRYGSTTHFNNFDKHWKWRQGEVTIITGYNNEGKSSFWNALQVMKAERDGWKFAMFCPENYPVSELIDELIHCYTGKSTDKRFANVMSEEEYKDGANFINDHFLFVLPEDDYQLDNILSRFKYIVRRYGVNGCTIDPYNNIDHLMERGEREDLYISRFMTKLKKFSIDNDVCFGLVAHQVTPFFQGKEDYPQPDIYKIKGGGTFSDKADNVISVWRPYRKTNYKNSEVRIIVGKVKKQRLVGIPGEIEFSYSTTENRYWDGSTRIVPAIKNDHIEPVADFYGKDNDKSEDDPF
jgi:twinkle protein